MSFTFMQEIVKFINYHPILSIGWVSLLIAILLTLFKKFTSKVRFINQREATYLLNREEGIVVDLRQSECFRKGHIAGSINLLLSDIQANNFSKLYKYKNKPIILVDSIGLQALDPASILIKNGFERISILKNGISGWIKEDLPLVQSK